MSVSNIIILPKAALEQKSTPSRLRTNFILLRSLWSWSNSSPNRRMNPSSITFLWVIVITVTSPTSRTVTHAVNWVGMVSSLQKNFCYMETVGSKRIHSLIRILSDLEDFNQIREEKQPVDLCIHPTEH